MFNENRVSVNREGDSTLPHRLHVRAKADSWGLGILFMRMNLGKIKTHKETV